MGTYEPHDASKLPNQEKPGALESLLFVTEREDGPIEGRTYATGNKQRIYDGYHKSAGSFPTVTRRGLILTAANDAHKGWDVAYQTCISPRRNRQRDYNKIVGLDGRVVGTT